MNEYYVQQTKKLLRGHDRLMKFGRILLINEYGEPKTAEIFAHTRSQFEQLIPHIPYIGGSANPLTDTLVQMTSLLALYRVLKDQGKPVAEIGALVHQMAQTQIDSFPGLARRLIGRLYMSHFWRWRTQRKALETQKYQYPGNFVYEVVEGDGQNFEWGVNYLECGVVKFFHNQQADEFTPYMCVIDFLMFPAMGVQLHRQGTIANGCTHCDFRFKS